MAIIVPVLGRPHRVEPLVKSIRAATPGDAHRILFVTTTGDAELEAEIDRVGVDRIGVQWLGRGDYARKIHAGIAATSDPYIFTGADDLSFHPGWLPAAHCRMSARVGVVGTQDMANPRTIAGDHATHFLVARWYVDRCGTIDGPGLFHEGYWHEYVDDELVATAKSRGAFAFAADSVVEHLHPMAGKAPMDDLYAQQRERLRFGRRVFRSRAHLWT